MLTSFNNIILVVIVIIGYFNLSYSWVFTDVNFSQVQAKSLGPDNDVENEIDPEILAEERFSLIYPGTKWCGAGDIADDYDDLGPAREADKCCREHDHCPDIIAAGETKYNLTNSAFYTRLSCACDATFRECLRAANSRVAKQIGTIYFDALGTQCYRIDYPVEGCRRRGGWLNRKCLEYSYNTTGEQYYQWFDVPNY